MAQPSSAADKRVPRHDAGPLDPAAGLAPGLVVHLVPHTHWDREWYLPLGRFRQRLVQLVDELLDDPVPTGAPNAPAPFLLDGQAVVLDDYLAVRPERAGELGARLREWPIEAGPWYVLADELIPSGEALVRNLLAGRRTMHRVGAVSPPVLYCPDSFGHPAALPTLAAGFGFPVAVVWRGFGGRRWPAGDAVWWQGPASADDPVLLYHLPRSGYEFGSDLPTSRAAAERRWQAMRAELAPRARLGRVLLQNGADHHARQRRLAEAVQVLQEVARPDAVLWSTLAEFAAHALAAARNATLETVRGELRDSYGYTWTLQGTFAARAHQKRRNARIERLLVRDAEPWATLARHASGRSRAPHVRAAWVTLLRCHPHDTLCGCSTDEVARAMDARLDSALAQSRGVRDDALLDIIGHDAVEARARAAEWRSVCIVRNAAARTRGGVAEIELETFVRDVAVGPGSGVPRTAPDALRGAPVSLHELLPSGAWAPLPLQVLDRRLEHRRTESPRHYPDNDLVEIARAVAWVNPVRGYGTHAFHVGTGDAPAIAPVPAATASDRTLDNGVLRLTITDAGEARLSCGERVLAPLVSFEDVGDAGDLYTHSPVGRPIGAAWLDGTRLVHRGPLRAAIECRWRLRVPTGLHAVRPGDPVPVRPQRAGRPVEIPVTVTFTLDAGARYLRVRVAGVNGARDHRLRVVFATGIPDPRICADAAFGPVERTPVLVPSDDAAMELPPPTAPLHRYVSLFGEREGVTIVSDGLAEYEARPGGGVAVTLLRAVGELSRNDLPERPGHAGWPTPTPEAQCLGAFIGAFAVFPHGPHAAPVLDDVERVVDDVLLPVRGTTLRSALALPGPSHGAELDGVGLAFAALTDAEDDGWTVARCVNVSDESVAGRWRFGFPVREARLARLDEQPLGPLEVSEAGDVPFVAAPRQAVTILVR